MTSYASYARGLTVASDTNPSAGSEATVTIPAGSVRRIVSVQFTLVTSATAANRRVVVIVDDGTNELFRVASPTDQTASITGRYSFVPGLGGSPSYQAVAASNNVCILPGPPGLALLPGYRIRTTTNNLQAGDDYAAPVYAYFAI
ncbi:MAG: hypothetical protein KatS3mg015_2945 [Fimbriimonadales bacterium]|nr:MAG: hypothetical protein KatS3mg015_2945 [Fimbriimonadales bacterium]